MTYDNTNKGSIWKNEKKEKDTHPDFTGTINIEGVEYWLSAWKRKPDASEKAPILSFQVKRKEVPQQVKDAVKPRQSAPETAKGGFDTFDSDIPFAQPYGNGLWMSV